MLELEEQLRRLAHATDDDVAPVTADEARQRAASRPGRLHPTRIWPLAAAAAVLVIVGIVAVVAGGDDEEGIVTDEGPYALDLDGHRDWMLAYLNGEVEADVPTMQARYTPGFLAAVAPEDFQFPTLRAVAPWTLSTEVDRTATALSTQLVASDGSTFRFSVHVAEDGRVDASTVLATVACPGRTPVDRALLEGDGTPLAWAFGLVNETAAEDDATLRDRLSDDFLAQVPPGEFRLRLSQLHAIGPFTPRFFEEPPTADRWVLRVGTDAGEEAQLVVETDPDGAVSLLNLTTQQPCAVP